MRRTLKCPECRNRMLVRKGQRGKWRLFCFACKHRLGPYDSYEAAFRAREEDEARAKAPLPRDAMRPHILPGGVRYYPAAMLEAHGVPHDEWSDGTKIGTTKRRTHRDL